MSLSLTPSATGLQPVQRKKNIGLTALIDVVFILLMFFMLTSSFTHQKNIIVNIPQASQRNGDTSDNVILLLKGSGQLSLSQSSTSHSVDIFELENLLSELKKKPTGKPLLLLSEAQVELQHLVNVLSKLQQNNIATNYIQALPEEQP